MLILHALSVENILLPPFASTRHFLDLIIKDHSYKERLLQNIVKERYYITKFLHTSYIDLDNVTHIERNMLLKYIMQDKETEQNQLKKIRNTGKII